MQDGAQPHRTQQVFGILNSAFKNRMIGLDFDKHYEGGMTWSTSSLDLNPCDFYLWGYLEDIVWKSNPKTMNDIKLAITKAFSKIPPEHCRAASSSFRNRLAAVIARKGGHFEHLCH